MKFCSQCGAANEDTMYSCYSCGAALEAAQSGGKKHGLRISKPVLVIGGILLAAALVIGGIFWAVSGTSGSVARAAKRTMKEFSGRRETQTQAAQFLSVANDHLSKGKYTMNAAFSGAIVDLQLHTDYSRPAKKLRGELRLNGYGMEYSAKKNIVQVRFPGEYDVYGFNIKDLNKLTKKINEYLSLPLVKALLPTQLPTDLDVDFFKKVDVGYTLNGLVKKELKEFRKSIEVEKWNDETIVRAGESEKCRVYKVTWDKTALRKLLNALGTGGFLPDVGDWLNSLLPELDPYLYCYVNSENYVVGIRFTTAGAKCSLMLEGEENVWDDIVLTAETITGAVIRYEGALERKGDVTQLYLENTAGEKLLIVDYNDGTGDYAIWTSGIGNLMTGRITCANEQASITANWDSPEFGTQQLRWSIGSLQNKPEQLGEKYLDLKDMGLRILENVIRNILVS